MQPICVTCGTQYAAPTSNCPICQDERQYVGHGGQQWTTIEQLQQTHTNRIWEEGPNVWGIATEPKFAIGQRALLVDGILWDCVSLINSATVTRLNELGGVRAIAISHPHYYSSMVEWSDAFNGVPIYLHEADREHVQRPDPRIRYWQGERHDLGNDMTLIRLGGHFAGYQVLHRPGDLLSGDLPQVCPDLRHVSFMYSYPNLIPLSAASVQRIASVLADSAFDRIYGAWPGFVIRTGGQAAVQRSAERYVRALGVER